MSADVIKQICPRTFVRLSVEPVQVELESADGALLFSALQSAFPNSTGIYFRPKDGSDCRVMLKFDGRQFTPPNGGWTNGEYFVELGGGGSRHNAFPFGSYEQASKQFERSVNMVQQMMRMDGGERKANLGDEKHKEREKTRKRSDPSELRQLIPSNEQNADNGRSEQQKERSLKRDFADLARICAGKDTIIDEQRAQMGRMKAELDELKAKDAKWTEWETEQNELEMNRDRRSDEQQQIVEMERQLEEGKRKAEESEAKLEQSQKEANGLREKSDLSAWKMNELMEQLKKAHWERTELLKKTAILEEQVNGEAMEFGKRFQERDRIQQELLMENTRLYQIKDKLEQKCGTMNDQLEGMKQNSERQLKEARAEAEATIGQIREELLMKERKLAEFEDEIGKLTAEKAMAVEQLARLSTHSHQGNGEPIFSYQE